MVRIYEHFSLLRLLRILVSVWLWLWVGLCLCVLCDCCFNCGPVWVGFVILYVRENLFSFALNSCTFCSLTITSFLYSFFCCFFFNSNNVYILVSLVFIFFMHKFHVFHGFLIIFIVRGSLSLCVFFVYFNVEEDILFCCLRLLIILFCRRTLPLVNFASILVGSRSMYKFLRVFCSTYRSNGLLL